MSCVRQTTLAQSGALIVSLAGPISYTGTQYMDFIEIFNIPLDFPTIYFAHFSGY